MNDLRNMMRTCGIPDIPNVAGDRPTVLFIQSQGLVTVADITILNVKDVPNMIKGHNSVPNQAARLGIVQQRKIQALIWWTKDRIRRGIEIVAADWNAAALADAVTQINIEQPAGDAKVANPGKVETGHKWTTWDTKWENYLGSMVGASGIPLDYVTRRDVAPEWIAGNEHDRLKYQAIQDGAAWDKDRMTVYAELKACCLESDAWTWIKAFDNAKDGRLATQSLRTHYEGEGEVNKRTTWANANIDNAHYTSEHTYSFEKFSTTLQEAFTILNENGQPHSDIQMVKKMLEKISVSNNAQMEACKRICSSTHGGNFVNAVAYLSGQVTELFPNAQLDGNKRKRRVSEARGGGRGGRGGRGRGRFQRGGRGGRGGRGYRGGGHNDPERPYNTFHNISIRDPTREFTAAEWESLQGDGRAYVTRMRRQAPRGGRGRSDDGGRGRGRGVSETDTDRASDAGRGTDTGRGTGRGRGAQNGSRFGGGAY